MKIGIDCGGLGISDNRLKVGVYNVIKDVLIELSKLDTRNTYLLYSFYPIDKKLLALFGSNMKNIVVGPTKGWLKIGLPLQLFRDKPNIFIGANQALPLRIPFLRYETISIFYDIAFEVHPELYAYTGNLQKLRRNTTYAATHSDAIIAISQKTKDDLISYYHTPQKKISVAYPPVVVDQSAKPKKLTHKYFLFVGAFKKGKNIPIVIQAFNEFIKKIHEPYELVLIGGDKWLDPQIESAMNMLSPKAKALVTILKTAGDKSALSSYYKGALALLSPSLYEGFGLPIAEAMMLGCPVIVSNSGSIPEIVGDSGVVVDAKNIQQIAKAMLQVAKSPKKRGEMSKKGKKQAEKFKKDSLAKEIYSKITL